MASEDIPRGEFEYLDDTGTILGVTYRIVLSDESTQKRAWVFMGSVDTAQQVVTGLEMLGHSCGAF
ncbi:MAG TPA: hypothetical protein VEY88_14350 [Archangium sp.]|nr:hypothetical protein [Archangium sp.]